MEESITLKRSLPVGAVTKASLRSTLQTRWDANLEAGKYRPLVDEILPTALQ